MDPAASAENKTTEHRQPSSSDLFSSATLVAKAAQATFGNEPDKVDKGKVAGAAADLLGAASDYAKLDEEKGLGKYVDQAEDYLHQYSSHSTTTTTTPTSTDSNTGTTQPPPPQPSGGEKQSGGGFGDYMKMAQGFLNK